MRAGWSFSGHCKVKWQKSSLHWQWEKPDAQGRATIPSSQPVTQTARVGAETGSLELKKQRWSLKTWVVWSLESAEVNGKEEAEQSVSVCLCSIVYLTGLGWYFCISSCHCVLLFHTDGPKSQWHPNNHTKAKNMVFAHWQSVVRAEGVKDWHTSTLWSSLQSTIPTGMAWSHGLLSEAKQGSGWLILGWEKWESGISRTVGEAAGRGCWENSF